MNLGGLHFGQPLWFAALLLLPLAALLYILAAKNAERKLRQLLAPKLASQLTQNVNRGKRLARFILTLLGLAVLIVALARPQLGYETQEVHRMGRDVIVAIDTSKSMLADDVAPNRLARARLAVQDLLRILDGDRIALVAFAGSAFLQAPLTTDYSAIEDALAELDTSIIPKGGTNLAAAIDISLQAFGKAEGSNKALVLFTDGEELDADAMKAAERAKDAGVKIFTVGVGSTAGALIPIQENGTSTFVRDESGQFVKTKLDESRLREIASLTGGFYVHLENGSDAVQTLLDRGIRLLEEKQGDEKLARRPIERYQWPLGLSLLMLMLAGTLSDRRRPAATLAALLWLGAVPGAFAVEGLPLYEQGKYKEALGAFEQRLQRSPQSPEWNFNTGAAAYKAKNFDRALDAFGKASTTDDPVLRKRAEYNAANTLFQRGANIEDHGKKITDWKNSLTHYDEALKLDPQYAEAKYNRDVVEKLLKEDEQKKEEQKKRDDKDKKDQQDQKQDQQQQQQQNGKGDPKQQQNQNQNQQQKPGQGQGQDTPQPQKNGGNKEDQVPQSGQNQQQDRNQAKNGQPTPAPMPTPGEKKEGELKEAQAEGQKGDKGQKDQQPTEAERADQAQPGEMSSNQARALLESMKDEEQRVLLRESENSDADVKKDW